MSNISSYESKNQCKVANCDSYEKHVEAGRTFRFGLSKGYCSTHYKRLIRHGSTDKPIKLKRVASPCEVSDCHKLAYCLNMCVTHYQRFRKWGNPNTKKTAGWRSNPYIDGKPITRHELYSVWSSMKQRCYDANCPNYENYGGRGIKVCERWEESFYNFYDDMGERPSNKHQLDRIDNDGDYTPENCRWVVQKLQANNKRNNRLLTVDGITKTLANWSDELGINRTTIQQRLDACGWSEEKALTVSVRKRG